MSAVYEIVRVLFETDKPIDTETISEKSGYNYKTIATTLSKSRLKNTNSFKKYVFSKKVNGKWFYFLKKEYRNGDIEKISIEMSNELNTLTKEKKKGYLKNDIPIRKYKKRKSPENIELLRNEKMSDISKPDEDPKVTDELEKTIMSKLKDFAETKELKSDLNVNINVKVLFGLIGKE